MPRALLIAGGILNTFFFLFHILLGYQIYHVAQLPTPYRALMEALNLGGVLFIFFFAYVSFFYGKDMLQSRLGRVVLVLIAALYLSRASEEFFLFRFTPAIFGSCLLVGAIYVALFVISVRRSKSEAAKASLQQGPKLPWAA